MTTAGLMPQPAELQAFSQTALLDDGLRLHYYAAGALDTPDPHPWAGRRGRYLAACRATAVAPVSHDRAGICRGLGAAIARTARTRSHSTRAPW
jgi:hypothetical protein